MKTALIVPTNRTDRIPYFLDGWQKVDSWDHIIVVEDNPNKSHLFDYENNPKVIHVSWEEIDKDLQEKSWIISRRDSAIRSYGFLIAHRLGADKAFTLDDDCYPIDEFWVRDHINNLEDSPKWISSVPGHRTRGLPYFNLGSVKNVMISVGLWTGIPDYDSVQVLNNTPYLTELPPARIMPSSQYFPICGMNLCMKKEVFPLAYFSLMGEGQPYRRFDDIWFGIIAQRICAHLGWSITCGTPYVRHAKLSDPMTNLVKEAPGIQMNEYFWEAIEKIQLTSNNPIGCMKEIGVGLTDNKLELYLVRLGNAIQVWSSLFN